MKKDKNFWEQFAKDFDQTNSYVIGADSMEVFFNRVDSLENLGNVLEIACGNGTYTKVLAKHAEHIIASDYSDDMVKVAKMTLSDYQNVECIQADAFKLNFEDSSFDTVFIANFLHVVEDCTALVLEAKRVLKTNGKLIILDVTVAGMTEQDKAALMERFIEKYGMPEGNPEKKDLNIDYVKTLFEKLGLKVDAIEHIGKSTKAIFAIGLK